MNINQNLPLGYYQVGKETFAYKSQAVTYASASNEKLKWIFYPEVWRNFINNRRYQLGQVELNTLYKIRAQQLRDKYDYLILHYSGGSDSHNILMTFINNNIKLDEVCTFRSEEIESKIYTPNTVITTAENIFSEWDYVTKPSLNWLAAHHPEIKITVVDMFKTPIDKILNDDTFNTVNHWVSLFELMRRKAYSSSQAGLLNKDKTVANIFGVDKPYIYNFYNQCFMSFTDQAAIFLDSFEGTDVNNELFYWSKDLPELPFEQAYRLFQYFLENKNKRYMIDPPTNQTSGSIYRTTEMQAIQKKVYYTTWDSNKFQVSRANSFNHLIRDRDKYYLKIPEFAKLFDRWQYYYSEWAKTVNTEFWKSTLSQQPCQTEKYFIGMLD